MFGLAEVLCKARFRDYAVHLRSRGGGGLVYGEKGGHGVFLHSLIGRKQTRNIYILRLVL